MVFFKRIQEGYKKLSIVIKVRTIPAPLSLPMKVTVKILKSFLNDAILNSRSLLNSIIYEKLDSLKIQKQDNRL